MANSVVLPFIPKSKKNRLIRRKDGKGYFYAKSVADEVKILPLLLRDLKPIPHDRKVYLEILVNIEKQTVTVELDIPGSTYDLKKHVDLDSVVVSICDGLTKSGVIKDDSRICGIRADMW